MSDYLKVKNPVLTISEFEKQYGNKPKRERALLTYGRSERISEAWEMGEKIMAMGFMMNHIGYNVRFYNPMCDCVENLNFESIVSPHWRSDFKGLDIYEILATKAAFDYINKSEHLDDFQRLAGKHSERTKENSLLQIISGSKYLEGREKSSMVSMDSLSSKFHLPISLFRTGMLDHVENPWDIEPDEFLLAMVLEDIRAVTEEEINSVKEAQLLVERKK